MTSMGDYAMAKIGALVLTATMCLTAGAFAADWPQFQGADQTGIVKQGGLLTTWPEGGPPTAWTAQLGIGFGGASSRDGKVYLLDRQEGEKDILRCWDLDTGKEDWKFEYPAPGKISYPGSRSTPAIDDERVYIIGPFGDFHAVDRKTGAPIWKKNILADFGGKKPNWAVAQSPVLYKGWVIAAPIGSEAGLAAFDRATGDVVWKSAALQGGMTYATPMLAKIGGVEQFAIVTTDATAGVDANTGEVLWNYTDWKCQIPIASAFPADDGRIFLTGGYNAGVAMFRVAKGDAGWTTETLFKSRDSNGQIHQPILYEGHLYMNGNDKGKKDGLVCMALDGTVKWKTGTAPGFDWGGIFMADELLYVVDGTSGDLCLVQPDPSGYKELGRAKYLSGDQIWGPASFADGRVLIRDQKQLKCVDVRAKR